VVFFSKPGFMSHYPPSQTLSRQASAAGPFPLNLNLTPSQTLSPQASNAAAPERLKTGSDRKKAFLPNELIFFTQKLLQVIVMQ
jgi:hypothetical protein